MYKIILKCDNDKLSQIVNNPDVEIMSVNQISNFLLGSKKKISKTSDELKRRFDKY